MKNLTWQNPEQLFVAQELINKVKSKCCGIKVHIKEIEQYRKNEKAIGIPIIVERSFFQFSETERREFLALQCSQNLLYWEMLSEIRNLTPT